MSVSIPFSLFVYASVHPFVCLCLSVHPLSVCLFVCLSVCLSVCLAYAQQEHLEHLLPPVEEEESVGEAVVLKTFTLTGRKKASVAGCRVKGGHLERNCIFRVVRDGETVYEGEGGVWMCGMGVAG